MSSLSSRERLARSTALLAFLLVVGTAPVMANEASPPPSGDAGAAGAAGASPGAPVASPTSASPIADASALAYPALPATLVAPADVPTVSIEPESAPGLVVGTPMEHELGHCGLWSPVDLDGSLWQPLGGTEAGGEPVTSDAAVGELINATPGTFVLVTPDTATFSSPSGVSVAFERAPGALDYPLCM